MGMTQQAKGQALARKNSCEASEIKMVCTVPVYGCSVWSQCRGIPYKIVLSSEMMGDIVQTERSIAGRSRGPGQVDFLRGHIAQC